MGVGDDPAAPGGCTRASAPLQRVALGRATAQSGRAGWVGGGGVHTRRPPRRAVQLLQGCREQSSPERWRAAIRWKAQRSPSLAQRSLLGTAHQMEGRRLEAPHATVTVACKPTNVAQCEWPIEYIVGAMLVQ